MSLPALLLLATFRSLPIPTIENIQVDAAYATEVVVESIEFNGDTILKGTPRRQIRGVRLNPFRIWITENKPIRAGNYVLFYNLCDDIAYPTLDVDSMLPIVDGSVSFDSKTLGWLTVSTKKLKRWLIKHDIFQLRYGYNCLPGRKSNL